MKIPLEPHWIYWQIHLFIPWPLYYFVWEEIKQMQLTVGLHGSIWKRCEQSCPFIIHILPSMVALYMAVGG